MYITFRFLTVDRSKKVKERTTHVTADFYQVSKIKPIMNFCFPKYLHIHKQVNPPFQEPSGVSSDGLFGALISSKRVS